MSPADAISFTTDHEKAQRNAVKKLAQYMVGCSCHGLQLMPRHVLPLVNDRRQAAVSDDESDSSSDSGSDESSDCEQRDGKEQPEASPTIEPVFTTIRKRQGSGKC